MRKLRLYSVSDNYIAYLRSDERLRIVFDNKAGHRAHTRKYLGVALRINNFNYFIPLSSPKSSDYIIVDGIPAIRKSIIPVIRMITADTASGKPELKGTLKLSNMIPVPDNELTPYIIADETDLEYQQIVEKEWQFIRSNTDLIIKNAKIIYNQMTKRDTLYANTNMPGYLRSTVDFEYAEKKCAEFESIYSQYALST